MQPSIRNTVLTGVLLAGSCTIASCSVVADETTVVKGHCAPESHIAQGAIGEDLTKHQSRFFCDVAVVSLFGDNPGHIMVQFTESKAARPRLIGYAGMMGKGHIMHVNRVYLRSGAPALVADGYCKFFFKRQRISGIACGAKVEAAGRRTVPVIAFDADLSSPSEHSQ